MSICRRNAHEASPEGTSEKHREVRISDEMSEKKKSKRVEETNKSQS